VRLTCFQLGTTFSVLLTLQEPCFIPSYPCPFGDGESSISEVGKVMESAVRLTCFQFGTTFSVLLTWQEPCFIPSYPCPLGEGESAIGEGWVGDREYGAI
jgi:hypothetical protein